MESLEQRSQYARFSHLYWVVILNITCAVSPSAARFGVHFPCASCYAPNLRSICANTKKSDHRFPLCITFQHSIVVLSVCSFPVSKVALPGYCGLQHRQSKEVDFSLSKCLQKEGTASEGLPTCISCNAH